MPASLRSRARRWRCSASPPPRCSDPAALAVSGVAGAIGALCVVAHDRLRSHEIAILSDAARRDPLTGLLNWRGFEEVFDAELERARRSGGSLSVVVGDLDRFKRVNDAPRPAPTTTVSASPPYSASRRHSTCVSPGAPPTAAASAGSPS